MDDPEIDRLWSEVTARWADDAAHAAFIEYCRVTQQLGAAAARYKSEAFVSGPAYRTDAERVESAKKRLAAIATIAMAEIDRARLDRSGSPSPRRLRTVGLLLVAVVAIAIAVLSR